MEGRARGGQQIHIPVTDHDLERANYLCKWYGAVVFPGIQVGTRVDEDDEIVIFSLVDDLGMDNVATWHYACLVRRVPFLQGSGMLRSPIAACC